MRLGRFSHSATLLLNGRVLVAGGYEYRHNFATNTAELYDPMRDHWSLTGNMRVKRANHTDTLLPDGRVLVAGGLDGFDLYETEIYDPASDTWTSPTRMIDARSAHTATLLPNGQVLVTAGFGGPNTTWLSSAELYDPANGSWTATGSLRLVRALHTATLLQNGKVLVTGGNFNRGVRAEAELCDWSYFDFAGWAAMNKNDSHEQQQERSPLRPRV